MRLIALAAVLTTGLACCLPKECAAQHISLNFGHHWDWHHDDYWHHYDHHWVPPPRVVYMYPSVAPAQPAYEPQAAAATHPAPRISSARSRTTSGKTLIPKKNSIPTGQVTIKNASNEDLPVRFLIDGKEAELEDGATQTFSGTGQRVVEFDRGGEFGSTRMELLPGNHQFMVGDKGWELVPLSAEPSRVARPIIPKKNDVPAVAR